MDHEDGLPYDLLLAKFAETDDYYDEMGYDKFARHTLKDYSADPTQYEHEKPQRQNYERLNVQYNGHRGALDNAAPDHGELFLGDVGREHYEIDMSQMQVQSQARMRFKRFKDDANHVATGGERTPSQFDEDFQLMRERTRQTLRIFSNTLVNASRGALELPGKLLSLVGSSNVDQECGVEGDPARRARKVILPEETILDPRRFYGDNMDQDMPVQQYGRNGGKCAPRGRVAHLSRLQLGDTLLVSETLGAKMGKFVTTRSLISRGINDAEYGDQVQGIQGKMKKLESDIGYIARSAANEAEWGTQMNGARARRGRIFSNGLPCNAEQMAEFGDMLQFVARSNKVARGDLAADTRQDEDLMDGETNNMRRRAEMIITGMRAESEFDVESMPTRNYRALRPSAAVAGQRYMNGEDSGHDSQNMRAPGKMRAAPTWDRIDVVPDNKWGANEGHVQLVRGPAKGRMAEHMEFQEALHGSA